MGGALSLVGEAQGSAASAIGVGGSWEREVAALGLLPGAVSLPGFSGGGRERGLFGDRCPRAGGRLLALWGRGLAVCGTRPLFGLGRRATSSGVDPGGEQHAVPDPAVGTGAASGRHLLGQVVRRIDGDWQARYGHGLDWLETFVEVGRFAGTCYRAANWQRIGETRGRSRQDREHRLQVPVKAVYLYRLAA